MRIAIVGLACEYPGASSPGQLWENVLAQRRAFRRLPDERMRRSDYYSPDRSAVDRSYCETAAVIEGYEFDRVGFAVAGSTYRSTDLTHWMALDVAARALADAGFPGGDGLPTQTAGVIVGNTLTGEFARANLMRLRWPYVRRTVTAALQDEGWDTARIDRFVTGLGDRYKAPFPAVDEDTLAGGLSNTIAGRICNHFNLHGGGFTVDGACSSSLLAVATACTQLAGHGLDVAIAGGVDLSIDPFEVVGFAKVGALADGQMRVYDRHDSGFWPGEGAGMAVLLREDDAAALGLRPYAVISGWGVSSDGRGGITRPEVEGYRQAMRRAYTRAGFGPDTVAYFEGHSTGTPTGDEVELQAISAERRAARADVPPAAIGSIKALIGHTKAACGLASLIKAAMAVGEGVIPPTAGCSDPHPLLGGERPVLRVSHGEPWPQDGPRRAGVTSMGFGGINTHVIVQEAHQGERTARRATRPAHVNGRPAPAARLLASAQDEELLLFDAAGPAELMTRLRGASARITMLSFAELTDLAAVLHRQYRGPARAAVVAGSPTQAAAGVARLIDELEQGRSRVLASEHGIFAGQADAAPRVGFLFPGQGSAVDASADLGGIHRRRFRAAAELYDRVTFPVGEDQVATQFAQPRIVCAALAGLRILDELGIEAELAVGHSVGELAALRWAGVFDDVTALRVATARGAAMATAGHGGGAMASIAAPAEEVALLLDGHRAVIAGLNGPRQTVIAGPADAVAAAGHAAGRRGLAWTRLNVSHAFHSPLVAAAVPVFGTHLASEQFGRPHRRVISTVTGTDTPPDADIRALLQEQITRPVRFLDAIRRAASSDIDVFIEVGPGRVLTGLAGETTGIPVFPMGIDGRSVAPLLRAVAAAVVLGAATSLDALFHDRFTRPLDLDATPRFFANPCETARATGHSASQVTARQAQDTTAAPPAGIQEAAGPAQRPVSRDGEATAPSGETTVELLRRLAAGRAELPLEVVHPSSRPLDDLHLSSITVGQIVTQAAQERGLSTQAPVTHFATATLDELAQALDEVASSDGLGDGPRPGAPDGAAPWVRSFAVEWVEAARPRRPAACLPGSWSVLAPEGHPLAGPLRAALDGAGIGAGVALCLPPDAGERQVGFMLEAAQAACADGGPRRLLVVQHGSGATALAKTLHLEAPQVIVCVVDAPPDVPVDWLAAEAASASAFTEVRLDETGARWVPVLRPFTPGPPAAPPLRPDDVMLVTGGGKGITAECALALALDGGAALALLGRADPAEDTELAANLARLGEAGIRYRYLRADVTDAEQVRRAVAETRTSLGAITAIMHGAGHNEPTALTALGEEQFLRTLAPKTAGLRALLDAVDLSQLRLLVTFGSIIGRVGLRGQADYATANEWLTDMTLRTGREQPHCRCLAVEWSVWSGVGMGERLGVTESLAREGITAISPDLGISVLRRLLGDPDAPPAVVVTGRLGGLPTVAFEPREPILARFTDRVVVHYPGIELITEADLNERDDPYLDDHRLDGEAIFPGVLALEAMAQVATALTGQATTGEWSDVEFARPIVVRPATATTIRIAALAYEAGAVVVTIRSSETRFAADHVRGTLRPTSPARATRNEPLASEPRLSLDPAADLYGSLLFQGPRFQRLLGYRRLSATGCLAEISGELGAAWFAAMAPGRLVLGDPGPRDAFMHAIQACVPDATLLPTRVDRLVPAGEPWPRRMLLDARERRHDGDDYVYDLVVLTENGHGIERWDGLHLHAVGRRGDQPWTPPLLAPFLQRRLADLLPAVPSAMAVEPEAQGERGPAAERAVSQVLGRPVNLRHRPDGRPEVAGPGVGGDTGITLAHGPGMVFAVAGPPPLGCDVERAADRSPAEWAELLTEPQLSLARLLAAESGEPESVAATRAWSASECLVKAGRPATDPLTLVAVQRPAWAVFASGTARVATFVTTLRGIDEPVVFAVLTDGQGNGQERR